MYRLPRALTLRHQHPLIRRPGVRIQRPQVRRKADYAYYTAEGEPIRTQNVRFVKPPFFSMRRLATMGLYTGVLYGCLRFAWSYMDIEIEFVDDDEAELEEKGKGEEKREAEKEDVDEEGEGEEEDGPPFYADEESTFIPLTWSKKMPRTYYKGSDPEWQEFIKIAKDRPRHRKVQDELVQIVYSGALNHPTIARQLGKDLKLGKYWLDISFPDGPPQEYERSGIEIGEGFIAWSQQRVSQEKQWRLMRALWPQAAASSSWEAARVLSGIQWRRFKQAMGWEGIDPTAPEERFRIASEILSGKRPGTHGGVKSPMDPDSQPREVVSRNDASTPPPTPAGQNSTPRPSQSRPDSETQRPPWLPPIPIPSFPRTSGQESADAENVNMDIPIALHVFQANLSKTWNPKKTEPPRGAFVVQGLVEVRGQRGRMLFDVQSSYDPKQAKYVQVNAAVRNFKRWSQPPRGGP